VAARLVVGITATAARALQTQVVAVKDKAAVAQEGMAALA
jgi:hypothetical protein